MDIQDIDFELVYEPGKDDADPIDFPSRHPLSIIGTENTERIIKSILMVEHAVVLERIKKETKKDEQKIYQRILREDWESYRKDRDISQFYSIRKEQYAVDGLIFNEQSLKLRTVWDI